MIPKFKTALWVIEGTIISVIVVGILAFGIWVLTDKIDTSIANSKWNNGICKACGGELTYLQAVGHQIFTDYIYECEKCGKHIELPKYMSR